MKVRSKPGKKAAKANAINKPKLKAFKSQKRVNNAKKKIQEKQQSFNSSDEEDSKLPSESTDEEMESESNMQNEIESGSEMSGDDTAVENEGQQLKKSLSKLQDTDPEFYKFLKENDRKLLQFDISDEDEDDADSDIDESVHKAPEKLEVDSEDSDFEDERHDKSSKSITLAMVNSWRENLTQNVSLGSISDVVSAFHAALESVTGETSSELRVDGSGVFNAVVELCVMNLLPAVTEFLKLDGKSLKQPALSKKWVKVKSLLHTYFSDILKILSATASEHVTSVLLKHFHTACHFVASFSKLSKVALKHLTKLWSNGEETVQVLSFLCILRLATSQNHGLLNAALKLLYIAYIQGSRFVSVNNLPQINFMRKSLANLFSLDPVLSYQHAFLYIRQLAIHLRNAVTIHKKESFQSVYNWQYIHSLRLWVDLLCSSESSELRQLLYPIVQIIIGCIKLIPTAQYLPLRYHCIQLMIKLSRETGTFIPTLPFILESLSCADLNRQSKKVSMKPFDFTCVLRLSKAAMAETAFHDAIVENVYRLLMEAAVAYSHTIAFPDLIVPTVSQLKTFLKECKMPKYSSKLKQLLQKLEENAKFINDERSKININLSDSRALSLFETKMLGQGTPLSKFWEQWSKVNSIQKAKQATGNTKLGEMNLPMITYKPSKKKQSTEEDTKPFELLPSDDEEISFFGNQNVEPSEEAPIQEKQKKKKKKKVDVIKEIIKEEEDDEEEQEDIVEDLNIKSF